MNRIISQFEHTIQLLMETSLETRLDKLQLFNSHDASEIVQWSTTIQETVNNCIRDASDIDKKIGRSILIVSPQNTNDLIPIGGVESY